MCGEHCQFFAFGRLSGGSSPRVRGTLPSTPTARNPPGIIPACAGNTSSSASRLRTLRDHPRVCGEHRCAPGIGVHFAGSSPRVRGTLSDAVRIASIGGIIPACAGNTVPCQAMPWNARDHPRVCGEHDRPPGQTRHPRGSSPRVRGTLLPSQRSARKNGIIPACAGNTSVVSTDSWPRRDHPRVCGEHMRPKRQV